MQPPRFQFTIRQLIATVGLIAVLCSLFTGFRWPIELAIASVPIGFLVERMRGESGVMGAMMAGMFGFGAFGPGELDGDAFKAVARSGFDAVFDATGSIGAMNRSIFHVRSGGAYTLVGVIKGDLVWPDQEIHRRELTIRASRNALKADFEHVMASIRAGKVPTDKLATHATSLDRVPLDMPVWTHERTGLIKAIITV